ncbi:hypothetical protein [Pseudoduganella sp. GCM10020061]|uniref:hypothetical protein n=1 Tax=Pseudoduganella sp. GCM10020061 TaxID=3317345 RepID=UPI00363CAE6C
MNGPATAPVSIRTVLAQGRVATLTATVRPRDGRADVKCSVPGDPALSARMQQVLRLARLTEPASDARQQVVVSIDTAPGPHERDWELAAVLADRTARGICTVPVACANGWSNAWQLGRIDGCDLPAAPAGLEVLRGGAAGLPHLGALYGRPDPSASVSTARTWFPVVSGGAADRLCWVEVGVHPRAANGTDEEDTISVPGADAALQLAVRQALCGARHFDGRGLGRWRTVVRFEEARLAGRSYELALVMADRLARGREFAARGRLIASGASTGWHAGRVENVEGVAPKSALILREALRGDRVLLPGAWTDALEQGFAGALRERGATLACIDRIGII